MFSSSRLLVSVRNQSHRSLRKLSSEWWAWQSPQGFTTVAGVTFRCKSSPNHGFKHGRAHSTSSPSTAGKIDHSSTNATDLNIDVSLRPAQNAPSQRLRNRGVILTGATSGIGLAIAKRLVQESAGRIILISRSQERLAAAIADIKHQTSLPDAPISCVQADLADLARSLPTLTKLFANFPHCNTLINSAGIPQSSSILNTNLDQTHTIINTNLIAPITLSRLFLTHYLHSRKHRASASTSSPDQSHLHDSHTENTTQSYSAIHISSLLATHPVVGTADYAASKAGLIAHTRTLAAEGARYQRMSPATATRMPFRANAVVPGWIDTAMTAGLSGKEKGEIVEGVPLRRFGTAEEVADAVVWAVGNEYFNAGCLRLDGGLGGGGW